MFNRSKIGLAIQYCGLIFLVSFVSVAVTYSLVRQDIINGFRATHQDLLAHNIVQEGHKNLTAQLFEAHETGVIGRMISQGWIVFLIMLTTTCLVAIYLALKAFRPIEATYEAQSNFIADASHELRTPLTGLMARTEVALMKKDISVKELRSILGKNLLSIKHLNQIIKHLLDLTRLELGKISMTNQEINIHELLGQVLEDVQSRFKSKQIVVETNISQANLSSDPAYLRQLITVLVENAFKYTDDGGTVTIDINSHKGQLSIRVSDTGKGMSPDVIPHIYKRFYRASSEQKNSFGMGLALAARLVKVWGGTIGVKSKPGLGSTFIVSLPG